MRKYHPPPMDPRTIVVLEGDETGQELLEEGLRPLQPDVIGLVEAAAILIKDGFEVYPYCTEDLGVAQRLVDAGCRVIMPWAAPIGSARGITNRDALKLLRQRLPDITLVVDAGIGAPSHAAEALELDAVLGDRRVHDLDRHRALQDLVERAIDGRHSTGADLLFQAEAAV